ncbi:BrnT family toxin [Candidatus Microgenomates bacterium]|nr:BrnT family toxin [Candidatus Microgenomates bacterium]
MDIVIDELIIEEDRPEHIAKHNVSVDEILEVVFGDYAIGEGKESRVLITGQTLNNRLLTVIIGKRKGRNKYGLVTARDAKKKEKLLYQEKFEKGIKNES